MLGTESSASLGKRVVPLEEDRPRRGLLARRPSNRRVQVQRHGLLVAVGDGLAGVARGLLRLLRIMGKAALLLGVVAAVLWGGRLAVAHVLASPRFALREVHVSPTEHVPEGEIRALAGVGEGDRLLAIDTDRVAARVAAHPWVAGVRVRRQLPAALAIEVTERRAAAAVTLGGLYLVDDTGRPFKRATMEEAEGLAIVTGVAREQYVAHKEASEAAFREALALLAQYRAGAGRPPVSEVNLDPRFGHTLYLLEGGAEIRLGRAEHGKKLARLDQILEAVKGGGDAVRVVHLDGAGDRIPVRLAKD